MPRRILAVLVGVVLVVAGCGDDDVEPALAPLPDATETVDADELPSVASPTESPTATATPTPTAIPTPTASPEPTFTPLPRLRIWPTSDQPEWARTPDEAAAAFAQHVAQGERAAAPRPALQDARSATAELPRLREDGSPFGLATTIHMEEVLLPDGSTAWVVISARSEDIVIDTPVVGEQLDGGTTIEGEGQGFEGNIVFQVQDQDGLLGQALAQGGALGENLPFTTDLSFTGRPASGDWAILVGFTTSAVDGSLSALTMLPMSLVPDS